MIDMENYLIDELHVILRITDRLWSLLIHEIIASGYFDIAREIIIEEMHRIGQDKLKVLCYFNLETILEPT
ncbi:hypothetical protein GLOIN_2v1765473 [Rhizophagus irregularis DAOM 181602=DAOM 197198]|nr:hypothetical protein GLOIN_2v1765473 [Rhizophagus irregularis DAOM 181602=DAOM 197198]